MCSRQTLSQHDLAILHRFAREHGIGADARDTSAILIACPYDAHVLLARVTILSPLALGLLGHAEGCSVAIELPHGHAMQVDIVGVEGPARMAHAAPLVSLNAYAGHARQGTA
ncbi:GreA/GreB family elongation factor [Massilia sp. MS-15]|uniref:GreA/GreB family elongation factor n=1 Tax=Massilia sp. MS-15 TaxID=2878200 RepID=UPI001CD7A126|nr:GreA/GreB family elongation factor [Massilia sp. MS-15]MCA1248015.1 GreA/GreB family elongation factor [Massilia sp. MS-15]